MSLTWDSIETDIGMEATLTEQFITLSTDENYDALEELYLDSLKTVGKSQTADAWCAAVVAMYPEDYPDYATFRNQYRVMKGY